MKTFIHGINPDETKRRIIKLRIELPTNSHEDFLEKRHEKAILQLGELIAFVYKGTHYPKNQFSLRSNCIIFDNISNELFNKLENQFAQFVYEVSEE